MYIFKSMLYLNSVYKLIIHSFGTFHYIINI